MSTCADALQENIRIAARNQIKEAKYNADVIDYNAWRLKRDQYDQCYNSQNCTGDYASVDSKLNTLKQESKPWNSCVGWADANCKCHHDWCARDVDSGWEHTGSSGNGCLPGFGYGICQRNGSKVVSDFQTMMRTSYPAPDPIGNFTAGGVAAPSYEPLFTVNCCQTQQTGNALGDINFNYNTQTCSINNDIQLPSRTTTTTTKSAPIESNLITKLENLPLWIRIVTLLIISVIIPLIIFFI